MEIDFQTQCFKMDSSLVWKCFDGFERTLSGPYDISEAFKVGIDMLDCFIDCILIMLLHRQTFSIVDRIKFRLLTWQLRNLGQSP